MEEKKMGLVKYGITVVAAGLIGAGIMSYSINAKMKDQPGMTRKVDGICTYVDNVGNKDYNCESVNRAMGVVSDPKFGESMRLLGDIANKLGGKIQEKSQLEKNLDAMQNLKQ